MAIVVTRSAGMLVLGAWLILQGLLAFVNVTLPQPVMPVLALVAGVLIVAGK